jgi:hypothetical protein
MNILTKFGSNWKTSGFREEDYTVKAYGWLRLQTTKDEIW